MYAYKAVVAREHVSYSSLEQPSDSRQLPPMTIVAMSGGELPVDQLVTLLRGKVRDLSAFGTKYESTVSKSPPMIFVPIH